MRFRGRWDYIGAVSALAAWAGLVQAAGNESAQPIRWKNAPANGAALTAADAAGVLTGAGPRHVVVQFTRMPTPEDRAALETGGLKLLAYLGSNAFFAMSSGDAKAATAAQKSGLAAAAALQLDWKLHPMLLRGEFPAYARFPIASVGSVSKDGVTTATAEDVVAVYVIFHPDVDLPTAGMAAITRHRGKLRDFLHTINGAVVWLPAAEVQPFAMEDEVQWVEPPLPPLDVNNDSNRAITQANLVQAAPYNLDGSGINVLVYDGGSAFAGHADFGGRLFVRDNSGEGDHPTHVSGTIGGSGFVSGGLYRGMAPNVTIQSYGFQYDGTGTFLYTNPGDIEQNYNQAINTYGAVISNNSIGTNTAPNGFPCEWEGDYGATDMVIDAIVRGGLGAPMRIVWANGNERGSGRCGTTYHTTAPPACAKNHITVGALNSNDDSITSFSSWGPSDDGRLKPDVSAPGCQSGGDGGVTSTVNNGGYAAFCGTSMASPTVCGVSALILQDYKVQFPDNPLPRNSTLKILLAHNAADLGTVGPDYKFGYGSARVKNTIDNMRRRSFLEDSLDHGQQKFYAVEVLPGAAQLKATLAWDDPPGSPNVIPELINDLDLLAVAPDGTTVHYPWTLDPANPSAPAVRNASDHANNIEQVVVDSPAPGTWQIHVGGYAVPSGPQPFSLATTPDLRTCSSFGAIAFNAPTYACTALTTVTVGDCDLDTDPNAAETVNVTVSSPSEPGGESLTLVETSPNSGTFGGQISLSTIDAPGVLQVSHGETITATYIDADDGQGHLNKAVQWTAAIDCVGPAISNVVISNVTAVSAIVSFTTSEPSRGTVRYGTSCAGLTGSAAAGAFSTSHTIKILGLSPTTPYFLAVEGADRVGNSTTDTNGGACYTLTTPQRHNYFTEQFAGGDHSFDLDGWSILYVPDGSYDFYAVCTDPVTSLPVDPAGSTVLSLGDDTNSKVNLTAGRTVSLYGVSYNAVYVGSNGYLTFGSGDGNYVESPASHFNLPRVAALFDDLNPPTDPANGAVKWKQTADAFVVTWDRIPEYGQTTPNTFQVVMYFDGPILMAWTDVAAADGMVGISAGGGAPDDYLSQDLSDLAFCPYAPGQARNGVPVHGTTSVSYDTDLSWNAGFRATSHDVYFGLAPDALQFLGNQTATSLPLDRLEALTDYYWRVDEVNASGTTTGDVWEFTTRAVPPDFDADGDVDAADYGHLQTCFTGVAVPGVAAGCENAKLDADPDIDVDDFRIFRDCLTGADIRATSACMP